MNYVPAAARAEAEQNQASDPAVSAFVSAHAGTGKTKLLIDRLLRLLLSGANPARILCLTYTKAAAAEMAIRLQRQLGAWVTMPDAALDRELDARLIPPTPSSRDDARKLFAIVLDLPGGMRIDTIHAFCQSLLRRFPLEAQISPHFRLVEENDARAALDQARETTLPKADPVALATLAGLTSADGFAKLVETLSKHRARARAALALPAATLAAALRRAAGATVSDEDTLLAGAIIWPEQHALARHFTLAARHGSDTIRDKAEHILGWLNLSADLRREHWRDWAEYFVKPDGEKRGLGALVNKKLDDLYPQIKHAAAAEQERIAAIQDQVRALQLAEISAALLRLAAPILAGYDRHGERAALLDYDDLILRTATLLKNPGTAWVLYKLDGGLDHLLLDEVQDTAPEQWAIADMLTADFFAGSGARGDTHRTMFAVGDKKQSIYSFQGADPQAFSRWQGIYADRVQRSGQSWRPAQLDVSFRSTAAVLGLVDAVFRDEAASVGVCEQDRIEHVVHRLGQAGAVELWPLTPRPEHVAAAPWTIPERNQTQTSAPDRLVAELSAWIERQLDGSVMLESAGRPLRPGDILVLVRRRNQFGRALVKALKARGVPVAGLDRMVLTEQPAVQDLLALCNALLLPQDDLTFCEMLTSPLGGLSDDDLLELAPHRTGSVRDALKTRAAEHPRWQDAEKFFVSLLARVDFAAPHALLTEALGPLGGRARLFARLGPEAAEPVDELLAEAQRYAAIHPPSLQGFLHWLLLSGAEVKREAEAAGDTVRIMTVHGAKGLEAPLVILPDTTSLPPEGGNLIWTFDPDSDAHLPLWVPHKDFRSAGVARLRDAAKAARLAEHNRLLYVALTRARDRLLVCGWETRTAQDNCWYEAVSRGMARLSAQPAMFDAWPGEALRHACPQSVPPDRPRAEDRAPDAALPDWAGGAPGWRPKDLPPEPALRRPLAPSRPEGIEHGTVPPSRSPLAGGQRHDRFRRGLLMHLLLQHLPDLPASDREAASLAFVRQGHHDIADPDGLARQALSVLAQPGLAPLFAPGSRAEQPISGVIGDQIISGQVDRLAVTAERQVLIADYKTNRLAPQDADSVPVLYLRQMAAYRAILHRLYPDHEIVCVLIWTEGAAATFLPPELLDRHAPGARSREA